MERELNKLIDISIRYLILIIAAIPNLWIFYFVFTPLTLHLSYFLFDIFFEAAVSNNFIIVNSIPIELINACIAGSAYYLLFILNFATPNVKIKKRIKILLFSFGTLLILNVIRIFLLGLIYMNFYSAFDFTHKLFWYLISIFFVVGIWFFSVKLFKMREIPFYSDLKFIYRKSLFKKK